MLCFSFPASHWLYMSGLASHLRVWLTGHGMLLLVTTTYGNCYMKLTLAVVTRLWRKRDLKQLELLNMRSIRLTTLQQVVLTIDLRSKQPIEVCSILVQCGLFGLFNHFEESGGKQADNKYGNLKTDCECNEKVLTSNYPEVFLRWLISQNTDEIKIKRIPKKLQLWWKQTENINIVDPMQLLEGFAIYISESM